MALSKKPWWLEPNTQGRQAYPVVNTEGLPLIRQRLRTQDGRALYLDMTPDEASSLIADLTTARDNVLGKLDGRTVEYPEARF